MRALSIALLAGCVAWAGPDPSASTQPAMPRDSQRAVSIGAPNEGRLSGGVQLDRSAYLRIVPYYADSHARWGLPGLVGLIDHAARHVATRFPGAILGVGDLSLAHGGALARHHSHESGRDADVAFYLANKTGKPVELDQFVPILPDGTARGRPDVRFDDAKNWALIQALLEGRTVVVVSQVFVAPHIRARLLRHAERMGVPLALRERAAERMLQPRGARLHDDHFHIRVACPPDERSTCVEYAAAISLRSAPATRASNTRQRAGSVPAAVRASVPLATTIPLIVDRTGKTTSLQSIPVRTTITARNAAAPPSVPSARPLSPAAPAPTQSSAPPSPARSAVVGTETEKTAQAAETADDSASSSMEADETEAGFRIHEASVSLPPGAWSWNTMTADPQP